MAATLCACFFVRFPVPFYWVFVAGPWLVCVAISHTVVLSRRLLNTRKLGKRLFDYWPSLAVQVAQIIIYPAFSALFEIANHWLQICLILCFPLIKFCLRRIIFSLLRNRNELSQEIAVSSVEICSSLYQSMIMQSTPSYLATALVVVVDMALGIIATLRLVRSRRSVMQSREILSTALGLITEHSNSFKHLDFIPRNYASTVVLTPRQVRPGMSIPAVAVLLATPRRTALQDISTKKHLMVTQALELLQSTESLLLVEYLEVIVPVVSAIYLFVASQLPSAAFNYRLKGFYGNERELRVAMGNILLYTFLQALTLVGLWIALRVRYNVSAVRLLAFVLESQSWSLQGKLIPWLNVLFAFPVIHYGADFSLRIDYSEFGH